MHSQEQIHVEQSTSIAQNGKQAVLLNADVVQRIDSLIFGYFQRMGYHDCAQALSRESEYLSSEQRKIQFGGQTIISLNDRVHDRTLEDIILLFLQDGRFDISRELLEFGENLRNLTNKYTSMTMQANMTRSDLHQKLYGKSTVSRHYQPTGFVSTTSRGSNYSTYTLHQSAAAKAQIEHQLLVQQAEARYREQQLQQIQKQNAQQQQQQQQQQHQQVVPVEQTLEGNKSHTTAGQVVPIVPAHSEYHTGNIEHFETDVDKHAKQSVSNHSEGSSRRKLFAPQNFNAKLKESIIDPIVGICNEKAWDNVSDIHLDDSSLFPGLDVIGNNFLAQFDYFSDDARIADVNEERPIDNQFMADEFSNLGPIHPDNDFTIGMMNVANEVEINSSDDVDENQPVLDDRPEQHEKTSPTEAVVENNSDMTHDLLQIKIGRIEAPEPLISPIESIKSIRRDSISDDSKKLRRHERSSSELSSVSDNKDRSRHREKEKKKEKKENERKEEEKRKSHNTNARRDNRESKSPVSSKRDNNSKSSRSEKRAEDSPRRTEKRRDVHAEDKNNQKRKDRDRIKDSDRDDRRNDRGPAKRPRIEEKPNKLEKMDETNRNERRKDSRSQRDSKENTNRDIPNGLPAPHDVNLESHHSHRIALDGDNQKTSGSAKGNSVESKAKSTSQILNRFRNQTKAATKSNPEPMEAIYKDMAKYKEKTPEPPPVVPKKQENTWKIPKKSSSNQNVVSQPSTSSFSPSPAHPASSRSHIPSPSHHEKKKEKSKQPVVELPPLEQHGHYENAPLCDGEGRVDSTVFLEPKLSVIRLTSMMINCESHCKKKSNEDDHSDGEIRSSEYSSASTSAESVLSSNGKERSVNNHPKSVQYAPQKGNIFATRKDAKPYSDDEDDDEEKNEGEIDSDDEDDEVVEKHGKPKTLDLSEASALLDELPYDDE